MRYWQVKVVQILGAILVRIMSWVSGLIGGRLLPRITWSGIENLRTPSNRLILTPNHKSYADHFFMGAGLLGYIPILPMAFIGADWLFRLREPAGSFMRFMLWLVGAFPARSGKGFEVSLAEPERHLNEGYSFCIYPEGGIRYRPGVHEVKKGAAYLARKTGVPVIPVAITGIDYLTFRSFLFGRRKVAVAFGKSFVIPPDADLGQAAVRIHDEIAALYSSLEAPTP